jgi:hypothetical protein
LKKKKKKKKKTIDIIVDTSLKVQFPRKSEVEFWVRIGGEFPHFSRKVLNIFLPFATPYDSETRFSAMVAIKTHYRSMMNLENDLQAAVSKLQPRREKLCSEANTSVPLIQTTNVLYIKCTE